MSTNPEHDARYRAVQARMDAAAARRHARRVAEAASRPGTRYATEGEFQQLLAAADAARQAIAAERAPDTPSRRPGAAAPVAAAEAPAEGPKVWELGPEEFRAHAHAALWPDSAPAHTWVPQAPTTIDQYVKNGK